jgi:hypothetical protein
MFNAVLIMVLVTAILGPVMTERFAPGMLTSTDDNSPLGNENRPTNVGS